MEMFTKARTQGPWRWDYKDKTTLVLKAKHGAVVAEFRDVSNYDAGAIEALPQVLDALETLLTEPDNKKAQRAAQRALDLANDPWTPAEEVPEPAEKAA